MSVLRKKSILHTPVKKSYLSNINPDLNNYLTKPTCVRKSTVERSTTVNLSGFDCLADKILKQKNGGVRNEPITAATNPGIPQSPHKRKVGRISEINIAPIPGVCAAVY